MTGMGGGSIGVRSAYITNRFDTALWHQMIFVTLVVFLAVIASAVVLRKRLGPGGPSGELRPRRILRIGFGVLWVIAGLLQLQPDMPLGLPISVVSPMAANAPGWVQSMVEFGTNAWLRHPITAAVAVVWLQLGLGLWLLLADRGWWSRAAGWTSAAWALAVWVLGNAFGGLFVHPLSWMNGAPGAPLFYVAAGIALGLPQQWFRRARWVQWASRGFGGVLLVLGIIQAWPGKGYWSGGTRLNPGAIPAMAQDMATVKQPAALASLQRHVASFSLHG